MNETIENLGLRLIAMKRPLHKLNDYNGFVRFIRWILRHFKLRPIVIKEPEELLEPAIYIANHSGASGPMTLCMYFEKPIIPWGAYPMMGNYRERWRYLYHVFYRQKLKYTKIKSFVISTLFAMLSKALYVGVYLIPTYPDIRVKTTMDQSIDELSFGNSLLIFPEDSTNGYADITEHYHEGFVFLALRYYKKTGIDLPVYPIFYSKALNRFHIGLPERIHALYQRGLSRIEIAEYFRKKVSDLARLTKEKLQVE
jgi:1-acyl-sn-glycerol-3-phosphate acyltransferase